MVENSPENSWVNGDYIDHPTSQLRIKYPVCPMAGKMTQKE